jgi:hypothetical protein
VLQLQVTAKVMLLGCHHQTALPLVGRSQMALLVLALLHLLWLAWTLTLLLHPLLVLSPPLLLVYEQ